MMRSMLARRLVSGVSLTVMLLCQSMAAALAYAAAPLAPPGQTAAMETQAAPPCHQQATDTHSPAPDHGCQDRCRSRDALFETAKNIFPDVASLGSPVFTIDSPHTPTTVTVRYEQIVARAAPPPLRLVYCRLLN